MRVMLVGMGRTWGVLGVVVGVFYGLEVFCVTTDFFGQVFPVGVEIVNEFFFPVSMPLLELLFSMDTIVKTGVDFVVNKSVGVILCCETLINMEFVFCDSTCKVSSNTGV